MQHHIYSGRSQRNVEYMLYMWKNFTCDHCKYFTFFSHGAIYVHVSLKNHSKILQVSNKLYLIKNFVLCLTDSFTECLDPGLFILRSLCLKFDILDLKWTTNLYEVIETSMTCINMNKTLKKNDRFSCTC